MEPGTTIAQHYPPANDAARWPEAYPPPWGYWATVVWAVAAFIISTVAAYIAFIVWLKGDLQRAIETPYDGALVTIGLLASAPLQVAILLYAARRRGWPLTEYFALVLPRAREAVTAIAGMVIIVTVVETTLYLLGQDLVPRFQIDAYRTAKLSGWLPGLFAAIVVIAPVAEELVFRGFVYRGFTRRPGSEPYAIIVLTLGWMMLHVQYDWVGLLQVFIIGLFLGWIRWSTGSTLLTILLHMLMNFEAMIETVIRVEWLTPGWSGTLA